MKKLLALALASLAASAVLGIQREYFVGVEYDNISEMPVNHGAQYYDNVIKNKYLWELTFDEWFNGPNFSGGWAGMRRKLENRGFVPVITYLGNFASNPVGGNHRSATNTSAVHIGYGIDLAEVTQIPELKGWQLINAWSWRFGNSLTREYIGNTFNVQQNYGGQSMLLSSLYLSYNSEILDGEYEIMLKFGRIAAGDNFMTKPIYWMYQNNAFDGNPVGAFNQTRLSAYPGSTWGAMAQISDSEGRYFKAGVYQINTARQDSLGMHGLDWSFNGDGVNSNYEIGWNINHDGSGKSPGNISAGVIASWYNAPHRDNPMASSPFNCTIYFQADYMIWNMGYIKRGEPYYIVRESEKYRDLRGIILWGVFQYDPYENLAYMPYFANGGLLFNAPFESRADDVICFGVAYGKYSDKLPTSERNSYEMVFELNYKYQINRFAFVQPNVQFVLNPCGGKYSDALVLGMQYGIAF